MQPADWLYRTGSIPANAGEPSSPRSPSRGARVYPRERGGTRGTRMDARFPPGLSPRTRGNPTPSHAPSQLRGSIPANAGEPGAATERGLQKRVYPRERGGTEYVRVPNAKAPGLSPRTRGNRHQAGHRGCGDGSIPANAGEPSPDTDGGHFYRVYPRERGGTRPRRASTTAPRGLSPRTRGNQPRSPPQGGRKGSIPANAGEPVSHGVSSLPAPGLSPRTRGNRIAGRIVGRRGGSIPANAGEPDPNLRWLIGSGVYPRERGGTRSQQDMVIFDEGLSPRTRGNRGSRCA